MWGRAFEPEPGSGRSLVKFPGFVKWLQSILRIFTGEQKIIAMNKSKMPLWVKISGLSAIVLIVGFLLYHLSGHGFHHHHS